MTGILIVAVAGILVGCSQSDESTSRTTKTDDGVRDAAGHDAAYSDDTGTDTDADTTTAMDADVTPMDADATAHRDADSTDSLPTRDGGEGDADTGYEMRVCSNDVLTRVTWDCDETRSVCEATPLNEQSCPGARSCLDYAEALIDATNDCSGQSYYSAIAAEGCGYRVIETRVGPGLPGRMFYDDSGELVGFWGLQSDVADEPEVCAGSVPVDCIDWEGANLTNAVNLCLGLDAGTDDAGDVADAGDGSSSTTERCYSPTAPDSTYEDGAVGCKCEGLEGRAVAVGHAVLSCHNGVWVPAEDGPAARGDSCAATVNDVTACLEAFMSCSENADGTFCGRDPA